MTVQLSVTVWTVICFILLMLILHNLLFKPVLKVMDARRDRISRAKQKREEQQKQKEEYESAQRQKQSEFLADSKRKQKEELENVRLDSKRAIETAKEDRVRELDACREKADLEKEGILDVLGGHTDELAKLFADSIIGG